MAETEPRFDDYFICAYDQIVIRVKKALCPSSIMVNDHKVFTNHMQIL